MSNNHITEPVAHDDEIDLKELFTTIWAGKVLIIGVTSVFAVLAVVYALMQPNIYRSEALLAPVQAGDSASSLASKFGGLASLAGVNIGGGGMDKTSLAIEYIQSRAFLESFMENRPGVLPALMAVDKWQAGDNTLVYDEEIYDAQTRQWLREVTAPRQPKPSVQEAHLVFKQILSISQDKDTSFVTLAIEHQSPYIAAQWVTWLVEDLNKLLKLKDIEQAERSIAYLQSEINNTSLSEMRSSLFELIQSQTQTIMLANASPEYIFKTVDPAVVPELKAKPKRALIAVLGTLLGGMLGVLIVLVRHFTGKAHPAE
jgi:LPS O-antigen subunit length determinant protein (WzzB/FepE family)